MNTFDRVRAKRCDAVDWGLLKQGDFTYSKVACLQAVTGCFIAENLFRSLIERHLGFLRRALPGTSGRAQKSRDGEGEGREKPPARKPAPLE